MLGKPESPGTIPCAISWLFRGIAEQRHKCGTRFSIRVSAVELCTSTNQIRDLLVPYHNGMFVYLFKVLHLQDYSSLINIIFIVFNALSAISFIFLT